MAWAVMKRSALGESPQNPLENILSRNRDFYYYTSLNTSSALKATPSSSISSITSNPKFNANYICNMYKWWTKKLHIYYTSLSHGMEQSYKKHRMCISLKFLAEGFQGLFTLFHIVLQPKVRSVFCFKTENQDSHEFCCQYSYHCFFYSWGNLQNSHSLDTSGTG